MKLNNTESQIPGGFNLKNAQKLGFATENRQKNSNYILVSYFGELLRQSKGTIEYPIRNTYVVFVNKGVSTPSTYECVFDFFIKDHPETIQHKVISKNTGVFNLNTEEISTLKEKVIVKVHVTLTLKGIVPEITFSIEHTIENLRGDIEALFKADSHTRNAIGGNPSITRLLGNDYWPYFKEYTEFFDSKKVDTPPNLVAAVVYLYQLNNSLKSQNENQKLWEAYINKRTECNSLKKIPLGITHIRPYLLAMFLKKFDGSEDGKTDENLIGRLNWDSKDSHRRYEQLVFDKFKSGSTDQNKIDIFNLLRFPRTSIFTCGAYLKALQRNSPGHPEWKSMSNDELLENKEAIRTIVSEYKRGPSKNLKNFTEIGEKVYGTMFTKYIETIISKDYIEYHIVKIKVLDIRSGKPLKDKKVKKLLVYGDKPSDKRFFGEKNKSVFLYKHDKITKSNVKAMKISLARLGYSPGGINNTWNANVARAYDNYWADRLLDNSIISKSAATPPDSYYMSRIIDEYNSHAFTNDQGIVEVKIPKKFLDNRKVYIDIGFWEFSITLEALNSDDRDDPISRSHNNEQPTNFSVICTLGSDHGDKQVIGWNKSIKGEGDFGWCVLKDDKASMLQSALRLKLKTDEDEFTKLDADLLSKYYEESNEHFVLFGMEWCQPVWDKIQDPDGHSKITEQSYTFCDRYTYGRNMHIVTNTHSIPASGKIYGMWNGIRVINGSVFDHEGLDVHVREGDNLFALHAGKIENKGTIGSLSGLYANLIWENQEGTIQTIKYMHMHQQFNEINEKPVLAGQIIGRGGRTGVFPYNFPGHVHLYYRNANINTQLKILRKYVDDNYKRNNSLCIPFDDYPLLFPCACQFKYDNSDPKFAALNQAKKREALNKDPTTCTFNKSFVVRSCWASYELRCPFMLSTVGNDSSLQLRFRMRIQAQLSKIYRDSGDPYYDPGIIDGEWTMIPSNASTASKTRKAIYAFKKKHSQLLSNTVFDGRDYDLAQTETTTVKLIDDLAKISIPEIEQ